jgi:hypothetical protein
VHLVYRLKLCRSGISDGSEQPLIVETVDRDRPSSHAWLEPEPGDLCRSSQLLRVEMSFSKMTLHAKWTHERKRVVYYGSVARLMRKPGLQGVMPHKFRMTTEPMSRTPDREERARPNLRSTTMEPEIGRGHHVHLDERGEDSANSRPFIPKGVLSATLNPSGGWESLTQGIPTGVCRSSRNCKAFWSGRA